MRGLDTRVAFEIAQFKDHYHPDPECSEVACVCLQAEMDGANDYASGDHEPPILFQSRPMLLSAWQAGQRLAREMQEINSCFHCLNGSSLCPHHDY
jgi:hypothetical protein